MSEVDIRQARPDDADAVARVYIESWHDTYPGIISSQLLCSMTERGQSARWRATIAARGRESVLVAEYGQHGVIGMTSFGPSRDASLPFDGEIYTLYVDPGFFGFGAGRALLRSAFVNLRQQGFRSCVIWAHAKNNARFFYEKMGGRLAAERCVRMMGAPVPEAAFGWMKLALTEKSAVSPDPSASRSR
jgi:ribosomal protein S18 acetylase RimI-like enzyme